MLSTTEAASWLRERDGFLILTHRNPDGDTIGSASALCRGLRNLGKKAYLYPNPQITERYLEFSGALLAPDGYAPDAIVSVDLADTRMYPEGYAQLQPDLCIDHHGSNPGFGKENCVLPQKAACGEIVLEILDAMDVEIDPETANALYVAIATDCGCFQYRNTTPDTLRAAARLMELGADTGRLSKKLFRTCSKAKLLLEGAVYTTMRQYRHGTVCVASISQKLLRETGATGNDMDDLASFAGKLEGVEASITLRELEDGKVKVSLRTNGNPDASAVCGKFGGGGHPMASGCTVEMTPEEAERALVTAVEEAWA